MYLFFLSVANKGISLLILFNHSLEILNFGILGSTLIKLYRYPEYVILNKIAVLNFLEKRKRVTL